MRRRIVWVTVFSVALGWCLNGAAGAEVWKDSYYATFTPAKFREYGPAQERFDFKNLDYDLLSAAIFFETNRRRAEYRKKPFLYSPALRKAAFEHSKDMVEDGFYSHENPIRPQKRTLPLRLAQVGISKCAMSENIAFQPGRRFPIIERSNERTRYRIDLEKPARPCTYLEFAESLVDGWMRSPGHRSNILSGETTYLGAGAYHWLKKVRKSEHRTYQTNYFKCCQDFAGKPGPQPVPSSR